LRATNLLPVTRKQFDTAIDRFLGGISSESVLRDLRTSIVRTRAARTNPRPVPQSPIREFVDTLTRRRMTNSMLARLRSAVANVSRLR
jgi:hypothetical protein